MDNEVPKCACMKPLNLMSYSAQKHQEKWGKRAFNENVSSSTLIMMEFSGDNE